MKQWLKREAVNLSETHITEFLRQMSLSLPSNYRLQKANYTANGIEAVFSDSNYPNELYKMVINVERLPGPEATEVV
jgi:hypothetical protein